MASRVTHGESLEWDSSENDENESDFESSESEEESFDDDRVYGFPNDRDGSAFNVAAEEESSQNDETDSQGSGFSDEEENNIGDNVIQIAFVDEEDPEIRVARHNVIMQTAEAVAAPELQAQQWRRIGRQRRANRRPELNLQWQRGISQTPFPCLIKDQVLLEYGEVIVLHCHFFSYFGVMTCMILLEFKQIKMLKQREMLTLKNTKPNGEK